MADTQRTPTPWAQSDQSPLYVFRDNQGAIDLDDPVAIFKKAADARFAIDAIDSRDDLVKALEDIAEIAEFEADALKRAGEKQGNWRTIAKAARGAVAEARGGAHG